MSGASARHVASPIGERESESESVRGQEKKKEESESESESVQGGQIDKSKTDIDRHITGDIEIHQRDRERNTERTALLLPSPPPPE